MKYASCEIVTNASNFSYALIEKINDMYLSLIRKSVPDDISK